MPKVHALRLLFLDAVPRVSTFLAGLATPLSAGSRRAAQGKVALTFAGAAMATAALHAQPLASYEFRQLVPRLVVDVVPKQAVLQLSHTALTFDGTVAARARRPPR